MRIAIIGFGLMGGSIGLAMKQARWYGAEMIGCTRHWGEAGVKSESDEEQKWLMIG